MKFRNVLAIIAVLSNSTSAQQTGPSSVKLKDALLAPNGFDVESACGRGGASINRSHLVFRDEEGKVIIEINNFDRGTCKKQARLGDDSFTFDGCRDSGISMKYDPASKESPFKGQSRQCNYVFRVK